MLGGSPIDVLQSHDVSKSSVYESLWMVVDVINKYKSLEFHFPTKEEQTLICEGFKKKSNSGFDNVIGALDGMLVWIQKPSSETCNLLKIGENKFYSEYKKNLD